MLMPSTSEVSPGHGRQPEIRQRKFAAIVADRERLGDAVRLAATLSSLGLRRRAFSSAAHALRWEAEQEALFRAESEWIARSFP